MIRWMAAALFALGLSTTSAFAHETTKSFLNLERNGGNVTGDLALAFRDIEVAVWLDENLDGAITWGEATGRREALIGYVSARLDMEAGGTCSVDWQEQSTRRDSGVDYLVIGLEANCPSPQAPLRLISRLFADIDPDHRLFLSETSGTATGMAVLEGDRAEAVIDTGPRGYSRAFANYFASGVAHLLSGYDHLAFLLVLILPIIRVKHGYRRHALRGLVAAITGFTLAHAVTLTAATTDLLRPRSAVIEVLIALSIVLTAIDNIRPFIPAPRVIVAISFGLIHGFGFASALGTLQLEGWPFVLALAGFNLGIELAQIALILISVPVLFVIGAGQRFYHLASLAAAAAGLGWMMTRIIGMTS